jgi:hypothetical protein
MVGLNWAVFSMINRKISKILKNKVKQVAAVIRIIMLTETEETSGGMNQIPFQFSVKVTVWGR